jgi:hypothetical protein
MGERHKIGRAKKGVRILRYRLAVAAFFLKSCKLCFIQLRLDVLWEPPGADPHAGWCGEGERKTPPYPIRQLFAKYFSFLIFAFLELFPFA